MFVHGRRLFQRPNLGAQIDGGCGNYRGRVVGYGNTTSLRGEGLGSDRTGRRNRLHGIPIYALYIAGGWLLPGRKRIIPYSIQTLKRLKPALFRQDLITRLDLLQQQKIKPLIAQRFPLARARHAHELLEKLVLLRRRGR